MDILKLCTLLQKKSVRALPYGDKLISVYFDLFFENYDYDIIDGSTRQDIRSAMLALGFKSPSSRKFTFDEMQVGFPKPQGTLGASPADEVLPIYDSLDFIFVTPTQALLTMLTKTQSFSKEQAKNLIYHHPANLTKVRQWTKEGNSSQLFSPTVLAELVEYQELGIRLRKQKELGRFQLRK